MRSICLLGVQVAVEGEGWMVFAIDNYDYYMAESVFAMRLVNFRSVTCCTDQKFKETVYFGALNLFTSEKRLK